MDDDATQAAWNQLMQEREQACMEALRAARLAGTSDDVLMVLAAECGVANQFYREIRA